MACLLYFYHVFLEFPRCVEDCEIVPIINERFPSCAVTEFTYHTSSEAEFMIACAPEEGGVMVL